MSGEVWTELDRAWQQYGPELVRHARRRVGEISLAGSDAEDLVQDAIVDLLARPPRHVHNARGLLKQAVTFKCLTLLVSNRATLAHTVKPTSYRLEQATAPDEHAEMRMVLYDALRQLDERERLIAVHRLMYGKPMPVVSELIGVHRDTLRKEVRAVIDKLRVSLDGLRDVVQPPEEIAQRRRQLMFELADRTTVATACRAFGVPKSTYFLWRGALNDTP